MTTDLPITHASIFKDELDAICKIIIGVIYIGEQDSYATPITWLKEAQSVAKEARITSDQAPKIEWIKTGQLRLIAQGTTTSKATLSNLMQSAINEASHCLQLLLMQKPIDSDFDTPSYDAPVPSLGYISDDRSNSMLRHSFLDHSANQSWVPMARNHLATKIDADSVQKRDWASGNNINRTTVKRYEAVRREFLQKLAIAIHLTAGQPSRRTELQNIRWQNSLQGGLRNIMISDGLVRIRYIWHKQRWTINQEKPVWRFLPPQLSRILVIYVSTVIPFLRGALRAAGKDGRSSCHLFSLRALNQSGENTPLIDEKNLLSDPMTDLTSRILGYRITIAEYRHIAIAYCRHYMHGQTIEAILGETGGDTGNEPTEPDAEEDDIADAQAAHSTLVANLVYAREYDTGERFNEFSKASALWHLLFHLSGKCGPRGTKRPREQEAGADNNPALDQQTLRLVNFRPLVTPEKIRALYKDSSIQMRDHQTKLFDAIDKSHRVVYVAGTGGGKSIAFALPAYVQPDGCNVVIQPTRALQLDTHARLSAMSISVSI